MLCIMSIINHAIILDMDTSNETDTSEATSVSNCTGTGNCPELELRPSMEFSLISCEQRLKCITVPGKNPETNLEHFHLLSSYIDFSCVNMVRAGATEKF